MQQKWPKKLTKPKSPFTTISTEPPEIREKRIKELKPNKKFHDFHTIQWLRHRYSNQLIQKSIFSLLPDNGRPVVDENESPEDRKHRLLMEWLSTYCQPNDKFKNVNINPKYFFNDKTFEKVLKLKEIFLEFDEDGSRKMEINEMEEMFNTNHICATINELVTLFFKDKEIKKEDIMSLYLDFYQFMEFALNKDQDFRFFMRKIKEKYKESGKNENENGFLPMNFNLVLDYFIIKGKERASIEVIEKAINEMDTIIENTAKSGPPSPDKKEDGEKQKQEISYDSQMTKINFEQLIQEFQNLFRIKDEPSGTQGNSSYQTKKRGTVNRTPGTRNLSLHPTQKNSKMNINFKGTPMNETIADNEKEEQNNNNSEFYDMVQNQLLREDIQKMNYSHYQKFHSLKLAFQETKRVIDEKKNGNIPSSRDSTMYGTMGMGFLPKINQGKTTTDGFYKKTLGKTQTTWRTQPRNKIKNDYVPLELLN